MQRDSIANTFIVAGGVCLVCSFLVASAAVGLRPLQKKNIELDKKRNILQVAGFEPDQIDEADEIEQIFEQRIEPIIIDLETGERAEEELVKLHPGLDTVEQALTEYDQIKAARNKQLRDAGLATKIEDPKEDLAGLTYVEKFSHVYLVKDENGNLTRYVFPIRGKGLWSILKGFIAIDRDGETIRGLTYYEHGETPGLGGEVDAAWWKAIWSSQEHPKKLYDDEGNVAIKVIKGSADKNNPFQVDGLSGATITSRGVTNMLHFWFGPRGFKPFLNKQRSQTVSSSGNETTSKAEAE